jgi:hypothetical protein
MLEEFALWIGCNAMHGNLGLCAINTVLIAPGVMGLFSIFILYFFGAFFLLYAGVMSAVRALRRLK